MSYKAHDFSALAPLNKHSASLIDSLWAEGIILIVFYSLSLLSSALSTPFISFRF